MTAAEWKVKLLLILEKVKKLTAKEKKSPSFSAVIVAAGSSSRMGCDKVTMHVGGLPVIARTVRAFEECELVNEIILVTREDRLQEIADLVKLYGFEKVKAVIAGGSTRAESSLAGVLAADRKAKLIAIHDCARPFVTKKLIEETACNARDYYAAVPVIPCVDTVKLKDGEFLGESVNRDALCAVQTPQIFQADVIKAALTYVVKNSLPVTDDTSAAAYLGFRTRMVPGDRDNIKLTTPEDIPFAEAVLRKREIPE